MQFYFAWPTWLDQKRKRGKVFWLGLGVINIMVIILLWNDGSRYYIQNPEGGNWAIALGRLTGLFAEFAILLQLVLIGRITMVEQVFGFDKMNKLHRWIGFSIISLLLLHPYLLTLGNATAGGITLLEQFSGYLATTEDVFSAFIAVVIFIYIAATSIVIVRKRLRYETWYFTHFLTYLAVALAFSHQINSGDVSRNPALGYWLTLNFLVFGAVLFYRFVKPHWNAQRFKFAVDRVVKETPDTYSVYITGRDIGRFRYHAGQFANITFLQKGLWFTHPFSFSSEPNDAYLRFTMKAVGDHTKRIHELRHGTRVIIDGPLGLFIGDVATRAKMLFIAGGIGVTPLRSLAGEMIREQKDMILLYCVRKGEDIAFRDEFAALDRIAPFPVHYIVSDPTPGYESGHLDREKIVRLVPDFYDRDVFLCGPPGMMDATLDALKGLGLKNENIHYEKFSF